MDTKTIFELRTLARCADAQLERLRQIRNEDSVRNAMYTTHVIAPAAHAQWLQAMNTSDTVQVYALLLAGEVVGSASITKIDRRNLSADWAFYLSETARGGIGRLTEYAILNHVFDALAFEKLNCEVLAFNEPVIEMHKQFGFTHEGTRRQEKLREGKRHDVVLLGMTREEWARHEPHVEQTHSSLFERFQTLWEV